MSNAPQLKAVIFDLDGVLVDTSRFHGQAWAGLVRSLGHEPPADLEERVRGISRLASLKIALGPHAAKYSDAELDQLAARKNDHYLALITKISPADLYPGARELFDSLQQAGIRIALGSASKNARPVLDSLGITGRFDAIADGFTYKHGKPRPDVFLTAAHMLGFSPGECIVVEDAAAGITAALDGGFATIGIGNYDSLKHAHHYIRSLREVSAESLRSLHARFTPGHWTVRRDGLTDHEDACHTIFCTGNGRLGVRGNIPELPAGGRQGIYLAGFYDTFRRPPQNVGKWSPFMKYWGNAELAVGDQIESCIVDCPNFLATELTIDGERIDFTAGTLRSLRRSLDLRTGMFTAEAHWTSPSGRVLRIVQRRFADMATTSRVFVQYEIEPLNFSGALEIRAGIRTDTANGSELGPQLLYDTIHSAPAGPNSVAVLVKGKTVGMQAAFAAGLRILDRPAATYTTEITDAGAFVTASADLVQDKLLYVERSAAAASDRVEGRPLPTVVEAIKEAVATPFNEARIESAARWRQLWDDSDVIIEGDPANQLGIRYSIFQLLIAGSADDPGVSIPAKGLTAEGYRGMVFWDTDIHMTSFFNLTQPRIARNLAMFRFNTLAGARRKAARYGFRGASFPWETGVSGDEECEKWLKLITHQSHITADVALALQQYVDCTGDTEFYENCAAELLTETARFWLSKCVPDGEQFSIPDAGGPDEFHVVCNNSAYVNHLARHNLLLADRAVRHLRQHAPATLAEIKRKTGVTDTELQSFPVYAARIKTMERPGGLLEQCDGFFGLRDEIVQNAWVSDPFNTQTVKQADVLMLLYLLPDQWPEEAVRANWDYYEPRTVHQSSLSHAAHGIMAAELGLLDKAEHYIRQSLGMDLYDEMGNAAHGAHMAAHGMNWSAIIRGYGGARPQGDHFLIQPRLPQTWTRLAFNLKWRGADFAVDITPGKVTVTNNAAPGAPLPLRLCGKDCTVDPGQAIDAVI